jgi:hypothetical protein
MTSHDSRPDGEALKMLFRRDNERERGVWVDRGIDGRVDNFSLCDPCNDLLHEMDPRGDKWLDAQSGLCPECRADFQAHALAVDLFGLLRPFNGEIEGRYITNDEFAEEPGLAIPEAFDYFLREDETL